MYNALRFFKGGNFSTNRPYRHISRTISSTELILVTGGSLCMEIGGERIRASAGDVLKILPDEPHGGFEDTPSVSFVWLHFDGAEENMLPERFSRPRSFERALLLSNEVLHYARAEGYPEGITECILRALLAELCYKGEGESGLVASIREWVKRNSMRQLSVSELAADLGYNADHLSRHFKAQCGEGLKEYIDKIRLDTVKRELLIGGDSLCEIANRCGFSDYKYFLKFFKYHAGMSPSRYKEAYYRARNN